MRDRCGPLSVARRAAGLHTTDVEVGASSPRAARRRGDTSPSDRDRQRGRGEPVVLGPQPGVAQLGAPVVEGAGRAGLGDVPGDRGQLQLRQLAELERERRLDVRSVALRGRPVPERRERRLRHDEVVELGGPPGDLVLLEVVLVGERLGGAVDRRRARPATRTTWSASPVTPSGPKERITSGRCIRIGSTIRPTSWSKSTRSSSSSA